MPKIDGSRVKKVRKQMNMTQEELAQQAYVSKKVISNIERGETKSVSDYILRLLSFALLVRCEFLTGDSEDPLKNEDGLQPAIFVKPRWDFEADIKYMLQKHSATEEVKNLMHDLVSYLMLLDDGIHRKTYDGVNLIQNIVDLLKNKKTKDIRLITKIVNTIKEEYEENK